MSATTVFTCSNCDSQFPKWSGKCPECGQWGTLKEQVAPRSKTTAAKVPAGDIVALHDLADRPPARIPSGSTELDRVLGGGFVPGSMILLGGDPGIGKSTLALQTAHAVAAVQESVLYVSGEESAAQVAMRLKRIAPAGSQIDFLGETSLDTILATIQRAKPAVVVIDSVQTVTVADVPSEPGSVQQIRAAASLLLQAAKKQQFVCVLVGHVTKDGVMAGPRALEHLVDVVLYLEGDSLSSYRLLRAVKNRFGATNDTGVFMMNEQGLRDVAEPSRIFLADRHDGPGTVASIMLEGSRPFAVDVQALTSPTVFGNPRRTASGIDQTRLQLLLAVLTRRADLKKLGGQDVFVNLAGGLSVHERAIDAAVCLAIASSLGDQPVPPTTAAVGEVGLGGELRRVSDIDRRIKEIARLGFTDLFLPTQTVTKKPASLRLHPVKTIRELLAALKK